MSDTEQGQGSGPWKLCQPLPGVRFGDCVLAPPTVLLRVVRWPLHRILYSIQAIF